jgi:hypothetical protein
MTTHANLNIVRATSKATILSATLALAWLMLLGTGCNENDLNEIPDQGCPLVGMTGTALAGDIYYADPSNTILSEDDGGNTMTFAFLGVDPSLSEFLIAVTFSDEIITPPGINNLDAYDLDGSIAELTNNPAHDGWFAGHCIVYDTDGDLYCELDDPDSEYDLGFEAEVDSLEYPTTITFHEPYIYSAQDLIGNIYFVDDEGDTQLSSELTEGLPGAFTGMTEDDLTAIADTARYNLGC